MRRPRSNPMRNALVGLALGVGGLVLCVGGLGGCGATSMPDPRDAALRYAEAAESGDADAIYDMLTERGKQAYSEEDVAAIVADQREEMKAQAAALQEPAVRVEAEATMRYPDGEIATLTLESGEFRVASADALPAGARTPEQALEQLRRVLARRSYAGLIRILSPATRKAIEADLRSLVEGLEHPEGLDVNITGDTAVVVVPGGHEVRLRREAGIWHVEDFD